MFKFGSRKDLNCDYKCAVRLLDDNEVLQTEFKVFIYLFLFYLSINLIEIYLNLKREHKGQYLLDFVCKSLNLIERDYFGLRYVDHNKQRVLLL
jgi:hypothetical protein